MRRTTLSVIRVVVILNVIDMDTVIAEYSSDSSSKNSNRNSKRSNHDHGATPGSNSNKLEGVLVSFSE